MSGKKNGKKVSIFISLTLLVSSVLVVVIIMAFYNVYDPSKYGRTNGGIDTENVGIPQEAQEQRDKISAPTTSTE